MYNLVNDMLDFSTINAKKFKKKIMDFDPRVVVNEVAELLRF